MRGLLAIKLKIALKRGAMLSIETKITSHLNKFTTAPFLFIGSGFSRRYLGTEDWEGLIRRFSDLVPNAFGYYRSISNSKWDVAAGMIADDFHEVWWSHEQYSESRAQFESEAINKDSPLKIEISKYLRNRKYQYGINEQNDKEIELFKEIKIDGIITTNWDLLTEEIFSNDKTRTYIGQKELLFSNPLEVNEVYKIHGCSSLPNSLVLTSDDYDDFNKKNAYLAAKLLTIFIEHPVIFIGYSLGDKNITRILESITACLDEENIDKLKDRLIFVGRSNGGEDSFQESTMIVNGLTIPITRILTDEFDKVYRPLGEIKRKFSMKKLGQMKSEMYELIKHNDPKGKIQVVDYNEESNDNVEFVVGFGIDHFAEQVQGKIKEKEFSGPSKIRHSSIGYSTMPRKELLKEILKDNDQYSFDYNVLVKETLPEKLKTDHYLPVNRFVKYSTLDSDVTLDHKIVKKMNLKYKDFLSKAQGSELVNPPFTWQFNSVKEVYEE